MTIAFTICCNNFLGQARTMLDSLGRHHPEIRSFLFIVDLPHESIDYSAMGTAEIIFVDEKLVDEFPELLERYNIMELNTAVRPHLICHLKDRFPEADHLYYLDPDLVIYDKLDVAERLLGSWDIIITPHFLSPLPIDGHWPFENLALNYGTYNMGFFALNLRSPNTTSFLGWWKQRTSLFGHIDLANGYFTDQIWFNLVPVFFKKVHTLLHPGYNMAAWNLHERRIKAYDEEGKIILETGDPLVIYHFSSWNFRRPGELSRVYNRFNFSSRPDMLKLYKDYGKALGENGIGLYHNLPCALAYRKDQVRKSKVKKILSPGVKIMRKIWNKI